MLSWSSLGKAGDRRSEKSRISASLSDPRIKEGDEISGRSAGGVARGEAMCAGDELRDSRGECRGDILGERPSREATLPLSLKRKKQNTYVYVAMKGHS